MEGKIDLGKKELFEFLRGQKLMTIASAEGGIWIASVYYGMDDDARIYFVSPMDAKHSKQILQSPDIAFAVAWYDKENPGNRKAVQGLGICKIAESEEEIRKGVRLHNENFPQFKDRLTPEYLFANDKGTKVWIVTPKYIKFWNDELYGDNETEEFQL